MREIISFSCRPSSTSSVFIRKYIFLCQKMWEMNLPHKRHVIPNTIKEICHPCLCLSHFGSFSSTNSFSTELCNSFKKLVKQILIPLSWDSQSRDECIPTDKLSFQHNCRSLRNFFLTSDLEGIKDKLVLLNSCSALKFLPCMHALLEQCWDGPNTYFHSSFCLAFDLEILMLNLKWRMRGFLLHLCQHRRKSIAIRRVEYRSTAFV